MGRVSKSVWLRMNIHQRMRVLRSLRSSSRTHVRQVEKDRSYSSFNLPKASVHLKKGRVPDRKFNRKELNIGTQIEKEHSNNPYISKQIAKAHLSESKSYYKNKLFRKERKQIVRS